MVVSTGLGGTIGNCTHRAVVAEICANADLICRMRHCSGFLSLPLITAHITEGAGCSVARIRPLHAVTDE